MIAYERPKLANSNKKKGSYTEKREKELTMSRENDRYVKTPLTERVMAQDPDSPLARDISSTPLQRIAEMEEVGDAIALMASPMAGFMQGAAMVFDGGFTTQ